VIFTFAATVGHLLHAVRKLSAIATADESAKPLFRGVRGVIPKGFWVPTQSGLVCATDTAFMSTSKNEQTPINYMGSCSNNVLWELRCEKPSDAAFHYGADISPLSQFAGEDELLFPPCICLIARTTDRQKQLRRQSLQGHTGSVDFEEGERDGKSFLKLRVVPHFQ